MGEALTPDELAAWYPGKYDDDDGGLRFALGAPDGIGRRQISAYWRGTLLACESIDVRRAYDVKALAARIAREMPADTGGLRQLTALAEAQLAEALAADAANDKTPARTTSSVAVADVAPEDVRWLWPQRIAVGKLTLLVGDPGLGKSFLSLDLAARVSLGSRWPDCAEHAPAGSVILLSAEDDIADTIRPRLDAAGADCTRIHVLRAVAGRDHDGDYERPFDLQRDLPVLEMLLDRLDDCRLLIIDPISCYCGKTDSHKNNEVRAVLAPLAELAARRGIAVVSVTHLRKSEGAAVHRAMGSLAFIAAARAAWCVTRDKADEKRRLFLPLKNNLGNDQSGLAFRFAPASGHTVPALEWFAEPVTTTADEALEPERKPRGRPAEERGDAEQFLLDALADGPRLANDVKDEAINGYCIAAKTLQRARERIGVVAYRAEHRGPWLWRLSDGHNTPAGTPSQELWLSGHLSKNTRENDGFDSQMVTRPQSHGRGNGHDADAVSRLFDETAADDDEGNE
jgi:putative DNA primase/helicase